MLYLATNGPMPTTAALASVTTGNVIKTMLQLKPLTGVIPEIVAWGFSFDGAAAATPGKVELIESDVAATVTAYVSADIVKYDDPNGPAPETAGMSLGTSASGYTSTAEGTTTASRLFDLVLAPPTQPYAYQFPLGARPRINISKFLRIRVTFGTAINMYCYVVYSL